MLSRNLETEFTLEYHIPDFPGHKAGCFRFGVFIKHLIYIRKYEECIPWFTLRMLRTFTWQFYNIDWIQDIFENVWLYFDRKPVCILPGYQKFTMKLQACQMSLSNLYCSVQKWNNNASIPSNLKTGFVTTFQYFQYFDFLFRDLPKWEIVNPWIWVSSATDAHKREEEKTVLYNIKLYLHFKGGGCAAILYNWE